MKVYCTLLILALSAKCLIAESLVPSTLDPAFMDFREKAFTPWFDPEQSSAYWKKLSSKNVPVYYERGHGNLSRDIYIPNPGIGYWVLGGLTKENLFKVHKEKLEIKDTLISASVYTDDQGNDVYWALWAPQQRAHLLTDKMNELGIGQAKIQYSLFDKLGFWAASLASFSGFITWTSLSVNVVLVIAVVCLSFLLLKKRTGQC
jgi:hypothetical protein